MNPLLLRTVRGNKLSPSAQLFLQVGLVILVNDIIAVSAMLYFLGGR